MTTRAELSPLFTDIALSADDASAIAAALYDIARCDGEHAEEIEMIKSLLEGIGADLGSDAPASPGKMTPAELAIKITDPATRKLAVECALLLAWADGAFSDKEQARVWEYATALGFAPEEYSRIESTITGWVKSGDMAPLF